MTDRNKRQPGPPKVAEKLFELLLSDPYNQTLIGDYVEEFNDLRADSGYLAAALWYWKQLFYTLGSQFFDTLYWSIIMINNYLKLALRSLIKQKSYSAINIFGFAGGIAAGILILLYAYSMISYDAFHENAESIQMIYKVRQTPSGEQRVLDTWVPMKDELLNRYPVIESVVRYSDSEVWIESGNNRFRETIDYADPEFFTMFSFSLAAGDPETAILDPGSIVISEEIAEKLFGDQDPIGKTINVDFSTSYTVTGILDSYPANSSLEPEMVANIVGSANYKRMKDSWNSSYLFTFLKLNPRDAENLESQFPAFIETIWDKNMAERMSFRLMPLLSMNDELNNTGYRTIGLIAIALSILAIASINFVNLTTARSLQRAREIGLRKVFGANRAKLIYQFLGESVLLTILSTVAGLALALGFSNSFSEMAGLRISLFEHSPVILIIGLTVLSISVGLISGLYPAVILSRFRPADTFRDKVGQTSKQRFRMLLVTAQFTLSIIMLISTGTILDQLDFMKNYSYSFDRDNILFMEVSSEDFRDSRASGGKVAVFRDEISRISGVTSVAVTASIPGSYQGNFTMVRPEGAEDADPQRLRIAFIDVNYFDTYGINFIEGRNFSEAFNSEKNNRAAIINEAAMRSFGWDTAEGKLLSGRFPVLGVVEDFNYQSLQNQIEPVLHINTEEATRTFEYISVRLQAGTAQSVIPQLREKWNMLDTSREFNYTFIDENISSLYNEEANYARITGYCSVLAVIVACLGLLGLVSFSTVQRTREIGIRKVLGANIKSVFMLLSRDMLKLVIIANIIAWPVGFYIMDRWLQNFAYRTGVDLLTYAAASVATFLVALLSVSLHVWRASSANPVDSLRHE